MEDNRNHLGTYTRHGLGIVLQAGSRAVLAGAVERQVGLRKRGQQFYHVTQRERKMGVEGWGFSTGLQSLVLGWVAQRVRQVLISPWHQLAMTVSAVGRSSGTSQQGRRAYLWCRR